MNLCQGLFVDARACCVRTALNRDAFFIWQITPPQNRLPLLRSTVEDNMGLF